MGYSLTQNFDEIKIDVGINDINYPTQNVNQTQPNDGSNTLEPATNTEANELMGAEQTPLLEAKGLQSESTPQI